MLSLRGCSVSIHGKKVYNAEYQPKIFKNQAGLWSHEQVNDKITDVGGVIGLTENDNSLQRWLVADPETAHLIDESEYSVSLYQLENDV